MEASVLCKLRELRTRSLAKKELIGLRYNKRPRVVLVYLIKKKKKIYLASDIRRPLRYRLLFNQCKQIREL